MDTMPWDYWTKERSPKPATEEALVALRFVMKRNPDHPGANHLYIHAVEAGSNPELGLPAADRLGGFASQAGHLVHMPAHIYMRVGQYHDATLANERAVRADQSYVRHCRALGFYPGAYYPHNLHFLWWAQSFEGRSADALRTAQRAAAYALENYCGPRKALEGPRLRFLPWLTLAHFGRWDEILQITQPPATNDFLVDRALWHFTRGLAFAARRDATAAAQEHELIGRLIHSEAAAKLNQPTFPVTDTLAIAELWLAGKVAAARGDHAGAVVHLQKAVAAADALPYMEPAYWPFPVRPALGAAQLAAGQTAAAEATFREDLSRWPRNGWGLLGLEQSLRSQGKIQSADLVRRELDETWKRADVKLSLEWF
jgi:tetratricopeptide (TPR) repeat protein